MKTIIAGSRDIQNYVVVSALIAKSGFKISKVVCGTYWGVDLLGKRWAEENGIPVKEFPADWEKYGKSAGPRRNHAMARYADGLILIHHGTTGSLDMLSKAERFGLKIFEHRFKNWPIYEI